LKILQAADRIQAEDMKNFSLKIIRKNFSDLALSSNIRKLSKDLLLDIIVDISSIFPASNTGDQLSINNTSITSSSSSPHSTTSSPNLGSNTGNSSSLSLNPSFFNSSTFNRD
jgi:hypothetical protein